MKKKEILPLLSIFVILLGLSIASFLQPDAVFSANENRYLKQVPKLTWESLMTGKFTSDAESYTSDQLVLRDFWMGAKSVLQRCAGKMDIGGVWLGSNDYYFAKCTSDDFDQQNFEKNVGYAEEFFGNNADKDCRILLAPTPASVLFDELPFGAALYNEVCYNDESCYNLLSDTFGSNTILIRDALRIAAAETQVYYHTDHHWTTQGAYIAYKQWAQNTGHKQRTYTLENVSNSFRGTLYSKVLLPDSVYDAVTIAPNVAMQSMECDGETMSSLYVPSALETKDKYQIFMGGNYAKSTITTGAQTGRSLLLIKDSFANCFIPFLCEDYDTITVVDLRYCRESPQELSAQSTDILILYEMTNFAADTNLYKLVLNG